MHKYGSRVLSSRIYRCYVVDIIDLVSVVPICSLSIWNVAFKENGRNNCLPLFYQTIGEDYELLNTLFN